MTDIRKAAKLLDVLILKGRNFNCFNWKSHLSVKAGYFSKDCCISSRFFMNLIAFFFLICLTTAFIDRIMHRMFMTADMTVIRNIIYFNIAQHIINVYLKVLRRNLRMRYDFSSLIRKFYS